MTQDTTAENTRADAAGPADAVLPIESIGEASPVLASDRTVPGAVLVVGSAFSIGTYLFLVCLAVLPVFFASNALASKGWLVAGLLTLIGTVPILGLMIFDYAYMRALAGFRFVRTFAARRIHAALGVLTGLILVLVHPVACLAFLAGTGLGVFALRLLARWREQERFWDFLPAEAAGFLSGRDHTGYRIATTPTREHALAGTILVAASALALVVGFGAGSYLANGEIVDSDAVTTIALLNALAAFSTLSFARDRMRSPTQAGAPEAIVRAAPETDEAVNEVGLVVRHLNVVSGGTRSLLIDVGFSIEPGQILAIDGDSGAGKSILLRALADPFSLTGMQVEGNAAVNGRDLWRRQSGSDHLPVVHIMEEPLLMPDSGAANLGCYMGSGVLERSKRNLEKLVYSSEIVSEICAAPRATQLPALQRKCIELARAFTLAPSLYLLDYPEHFLGEKQISALVSRLKEEARLGRCCVLVTRNRALLEICDKTLVLQEGRIVDFGSAEDIRERKAAGWSRFVAERTLDVEEYLENWIRSHFRRPGDEPNKRKVAHVASELLAFSCSDVSGPDSGKSIVFEFKHFEGHCILRMQDVEAPISSSTLARATAELKRRKDSVRLSPLASVLGNTEDVDIGTDFDRRTISVKVATFDPRLKQAETADETKGT